jgi:hypothetical protein
MNLGKDVKVTRVLNAVAAGTSNQSGSILDMSGFEGVMFVALLGALTATQVTALKAQQGQASGGGDMADLLGTKVGPMGDDDDNKGLVLDVYKPRERYVRCVVERATANAVIDGVIAIQYGAGKRPTVHDATTIFGAETHVSPAEGTA